MIPFMAASNKTAYTFPPLKINLNEQKHESAVTSCARVHQLFCQISNLSDTILLICSFIVVPRELPFFFCSVAWTRLHAGAPFTPASCWARPQRNILDTARWGPLRRCHSSVHFAALCAPSNKSNDGFEDSFCFRRPKELQPSPGKSTKRVRQKEFSTVYWLLEPGLTYKCGRFRGFILDTLNIFKPHTSIHLLQLNSCV